MSLYSESLLLRHRVRPLLAPQRRLPVRRLQVRRRGQLLLHLQHRRGHHRRRFQAWDERP